MSALSRFQMQMTQKNKFKNLMINIILDRAINSLSERYEQLQSFNYTWAFLNNLKNLPNKNKLKRNMSRFEG